ncbi:MAG: hypothetical protein ACLQIB_32050 [Isosphaeraceae bacterium]
MEAPTPFGTQNLIASFCWLGDRYRHESGVLAEEERLNRDHREQIDADIRTDADFDTGLTGVAFSPPSLLVQRLACRHGQGDPFSPR